MMVIYTEQIIFSKFLLNVHEKCIVGTLGLSPKINALESHIQINYAQSYMF